MKKNNILMGNKKVCLKCEFYNGNCCNKLQDAFTEIMINNILGINSSVEETNNLIKKSQCPYKAEQLLFDLYQDK